MQTRHRDRLPCMVVALVLSLSVATPALQAGEPAPLTGLDAYVTRSMQAWQVPGLAIAVVKDGRVVMAKGFGVRRLGGSARVNADTVFGIASNSKLFTSVSLGMLVDGGKLEWDSHVADYLPDFRLHDPYPTREATVRDLLTHRSGYCGAQFLWYGSSNSSAEIIHKLRWLKPRHSFRSRYCYSNIMLMAAGEIVPAISGKSWGDFVRTHIFEPLQMSRSSTSIGSLKSQRNVVTPHALVDGRVQPIHWVNVDNVTPAAGVNSSVDDMAHWLIMLLGDGEYQGKRIISQDALHHIESPQIVVPQSASEQQRSEKYKPPVLARSYGFALAMGVYRGHRILWHNGDIDGMDSRITMIPDMHLGVVILSNLEKHQLVDALAYRIVDAYLHAPARDWSASLLTLRNERKAEGDEQARKLADSRIPGARAPLPLADYTGTYGDKLHGPVQVKQQDGHLVLSRGKIFVGDLEPWNHELFRVTWRYHYLGKSYVQFGLDPTGHPDSLTLLDTGTSWPVQMPREQDDRHETASETR